MDLDSIINKENEEKRIHFNKQFNVPTQSNSQDLEKRIIKPDKKGVKQIELIKKEKTQKNQEGNNTGN